MKEWALNNRSIPLYFQLEQILKSKILTGGFSPREKIPTETELCDAYRVSKITVRQAILNLVNEGLLVRKQGKGTFTRENGMKRASTFKFSGNINDFISDGLKMKEVKQPRRLGPTGCRPFALVTAPILRKMWGRRSNSSSSRPMSRPTQSSRSMSRQGKLVVTGQA